MKHSFQLATLMALLCCGNTVSEAQQNVVHDLVSKVTHTADSIGLRPIVGAPAFGAVIDYNQYPQLTNIPTLYLTCKQGVTLDYANKTDTYYDATIVLVDQHGTIKQRNEDVTFRGRGNATWNSGSAKKPWRLKFPNKTSLLTEYDLATGKEVKNFADAKSWTLLSNHFDKSMIRNAVTYELGKLIGLPFCPAYKFVDLVLNGEYYGTYQISDHMEVAKKRVFVRNKDLDWMIELCDGMYGEDPQFSAGGYHFNVKSPEDDATIAAMQAYMTNVMSTVSAKSNLSKYMDIKSLADYMIGVDVSGNYDGAKGNNYCYRGTEETDLLKWGPIWDLDLGYGNVGGWAKASDIEHKHMWQIQGEWSYMSPFFVNVYNSVEFQKHFYPRWKKLYDAGLVTNLNAKVDKIYNEVKNSAIKNYVDGGHNSGYNTEKWSMGTSNMGLTYTNSHDPSVVATDYKQAVDDIKAFLSKHIEWLNGQYAQDYLTITGLDPETAVEPEDEVVVPTPGPGDTTADKGLSVAHDTEWEGWGAKLYTYTGSASTMKEGTTIEISTTNSNTDLYYGANHNTNMWKDDQVSFTLSAEEAATLAQNSYTFLIVVWGGECTSVNVTLASGSNGNEDDPVDPGTTEDSTDDSHPGALVVNADGTYTFSGSAESFKVGAVITILTENVNATVSTQIGGNAWQNSKSITLTAEDVNKLKAAGYTFTVSTSDAVKAITVKAPASQGTDGEKKTYNATIVNKCFSIPANDIPVGTEKISITIVGNEGSGIWVKYNLKGSSNEYDNNTKIVKEWDSNTRTVSFDITDAAEISNARTYGINILTGDFLTATITMICSGSGIATTPTVTPTHTLSLTASEGGSVSGAGTYDENTTVIIKAVAAEGYKFKGWSDGNTLATRSVTLTSDNISLTATFELDGEETPGEDDSDPFNEKGEHQQLTNLPTIYLDAEVGNEWSGASLEVFDADNKLGQGVSWTKTTADVSVQYQGSGDKNKDSYRLKFEAKTQLLSSGKFKQWVLLANDDDPTMMRNALAKEMGDALGLPFTPGYQFVDLYVNNTYMGTYQVTDRIKVESGRALVTGGNKDLDWQVRFNDAGEHNEDKPAYYIKGTTSMPYIIPKNPDPKDDVTTWNSTLKSAMTTYFNNVFATDASGKYTALAENVDKQQLIQWYIAQEMLGVYKGFSSIEAYRSVAAADQNLHIGILWDSEKAFGNTGEAPAISMADIDDNTKFDGLMTNYAAYDVMKNIFTQLWKERWFANGVNNLWKEKHEAMLSAMTTKATALKTELTDSWVQNATKWNVTGEQATSINAMTAWLTERDAYLTKKFAALAAAVPCETHTYETHNYIEQTNGTFLLGCDVCGTIKEGSETYYKFTVYPESAESTEIIATSWHPSDEHPNSIAVVEAKRSIVEKIEGWNIVCGKKSTLSDGTEGLTCKDFRLTDGHPYYSENKFVADTATYCRALTNAWGTLCLPFKTQEASTEYASFYHLDSYVDGSNGGAASLVFKPVEPEESGNCSAYMPVVFKATNKAMDDKQLQISWNDITVKKNTEPTTTASESTGWTLNGTVKEDATAQATTDSPVYYIAQNKFWYAEQEVKVSAFRAWYTVEAASTEAAPAACRIVITDETSSIDEIQPDDEQFFQAVPAPLYDLQGRPVSGTPTPGLYLRGSQKVLLR